MNTLDKIIYGIKKKGLTDSKFIELTGVPSSAVTDWKTGKTKSYFKYIPKIAEVLEVSEDYLLLDEMQPTMINSSNDLGLTRLEEFKRDLIKYGFMKPDEDISQEALEHALKHLELLVKQFIK